MLLRREPGRGQGLSKELGREVVIVVLQTEGHIQRRVPVHVVLHRVVDPHRAGRGADGQQQEQAYHRHGQVVGGDAGAELPQYEQIQIPQVKALVPLDQAQQKAGQGAEEEQGAQSSQNQHQGEDPVHLLQQTPPEEQGVRRAQQRRDRRNSTTETRTERSLSS